MDWNKDGHLDIIIGEYGVKTGTPTGKVRFFERKPDGGLKESVPLKCAGEEITNRYTSPCIVDWNNDGKLDMVLGSNHKVAQLFLNTGFNKQYEFKSVSDLKTVSGTPIGIRIGRQQVRVLDFNKDGKKDLITCGWNGDRDGEVFFFYANIGTDAKPEFDKAVPLKYEDQTPVRTRATHCNARFDIFDYNGDGFLDLIFVDYRDNYINPIKICLGTR